MSNRIILGLTGPVGSGVSTLSRVLEKEGFVRVAVADAIKTEYLRRKEHEKRVDGGTHRLESERWLVSCPKNPLN